MAETSATFLPGLEKYSSTRNTGILPSQKIQELIDLGHIAADSPFCPDQIQPASLDLRLGPIAYRVRASFLSSNKLNFREKLREFQLYSVDLSHPAVLERGCVYIAQVMEELHLPADVLAKANPKSSTGRLDIFARLIAEYGGEFESVPKGYSGRLYTEIVPRTFGIVVQAGTRLNQLRLAIKRTSQLHLGDETLGELDEDEPLVYTQDEVPGEALIRRGLRLCVDLTGDDKSDLIGYRAKKNAPIVDLQRINYYDPAEYWEPVRRTKSGSLILDPSDFYILASKNRVRIPPDYAAEMVPFDATLGELRLHYAGFFDPGFGYGDDVKGTHAVLEVRSHEVPFLLEEEHPVSRLNFEPLLERPMRIYGQGIGSSYQHQRLALSKHFRR